MNDVSSYEYIMITNSHNTILGMGKYRLEIHHKTLIPVHELLGYRIIKSTAIQCTCRPDL